MFFVDEITFECLNELIEKKNIERLREIFKDYNSVDLAEKVNQLDIKKTIFIFKTIPSCFTAEIFSYLDNFERW